MAWGRSRNKDEYFQSSRGLVSRVCAVLLFLFIVTALTIMMTLFLVHPHSPGYRLLNVQITDLTITALGSPIVSTDPDDPVDSVLNSDINVSLECDDKNHHLGTYNGRLQVILYYSGIEIGRTEFAPFYQEAQNRTVVLGVVSIRDHLLKRSAAANLNADLTRDAINLQSEIAARVKFVYGIWKSSWHRWFRVKCDLVVSSPTASTGSLIMSQTC
ncbi:hypothetical protein O6H91_15G083100 [Diphasiastrum complanatum]|uniref:Uncharacterized protein n=1 Tax=Diphasiastrum complanatum TaxID=34168 RepID=A0ACC2BKA5_DIPCM|nr:hypothetical protein O6H91_15G083100 [Diphasiastrum complanatum]